MKKFLFIVFACTQLIAATHKRAIVFGATSLLSKSLIMKLLAEGYKVGALAASVEELRQLKSETKDVIFVRRFRVMHAQSREDIAQLISDMGGLPDLVVINDSLILANTVDEFNREIQYKLIRINIIGYASIIQYFMQMWIEQNYPGHIVSIVSTDSTRKSTSMPFSIVSTEFIRNLSDEMAQYSDEYKKQVSFTTVSSDWNTLSTQSYTQSALDTSVQTIFNAIQSKAAQVEVSQYLYLVNMLMQVMPDWLYKAVGGKS